jgi:hypothetical protein
MQSSSTLVQKRDVVGDTTVLTTVSGSVWGDTMRLVEELRIGSDRDDDYVIGRVFHLDVSPQGTIYSHDLLTDIVRAYDSGGTFIRRIGRIGRGPGEYLGVGDIDVLRDGRVLLANNGSNRILVFDRSGRYLERWAGPSSGVGSGAVVVDTTGRVHIQVWTGRYVEGKPWPLAYVRLDAKGRCRDTLAFALPGFVDIAGEFKAGNHVALHPYGFYITGHSARYSFDMHMARGKILRIVRLGEKPVPYSEAERARAEVVRVAPDNVGPPPGIELTSHKPVYERIIPARDGPIWLALSTPSVLRNGEWHQEARFDVFAPDGRYLGRVIGPEDATIRVVRGNRVWGTLMDRDGVTHIIRWRIGGKTRTQRKG